MDALTKARIMLMSVPLLLLSACTTISQAPDPPFNLEKGAPTLTASDIDGLISATTVAERNKPLRQLIARIDLAYLDFSQGLVSSKSHREAVTGLLGLGAGVASSLTGSPGVKANYSALGTLLTGGTAVYDKSYLFGQTTAALISSMDDQRAQVQREIRLAMRKSIEEYPGQTAFGDAIRYYRAGTIASAVLHLQQIASSSAVDSIEDLREVTIPTDEEVAAAIANTEDVVALINDEANTERLRAVLVEWRVPGIDADSSREELKSSAYAYLRVHPERMRDFATEIRAEK